MESRTVGGCQKRKDICRCAGIFLKTDITESSQYKQYPATLSLFNMSITGQRKRPAGA